jgi:multiple sugar transport system substrate-binding protein
MCDWENEYLQFVYQWGGRMYSADGTRCVIDSPEAIAAVQFMADLIYRYKVSPSPVEETGMATTGGWGWASIHYFGAKNVAMATGGRWWLSTLRNYPNLQLGLAEAPHGTQRVFLGYGKTTLINRSSPRRHDALKYFRFLQSEEYNKLINHQADGVCPVIKYAQGPDFLHDPDYPQEDFNQIWTEMMNASIPEQVSPFINGHVATRLVAKQLGMIKAGNKTVPQAMRDAARNVNNVIQTNLEENPELKRRYELLTAQAVAR